MHAPPKLKNIHIYLTVPQGGHLQFGRLLILCAK
jgi:hypothetical protein